MEEEGKETRLELSHSLALLGNVKSLRSVGYDFFSLDIAITYSVVGRSKCMRYLRWFFHNCQCVSFGRSMRHRITGGKGETAAKRLLGQIPITFCKTKAVHVICVGLYALIDSIVLFYPKIVMGDPGDLINYFKVLLFHDLINLPVSKI